MIGLSLVILVVCVSYSSQQGHPPGVPPHGNSPPAGGAVHEQEIRHPPHGGFGAKPHDAEHIKEHLKEIVDKPKEEMSEDELEFHYFKLHDYDSNNKLDGTEITKAITHFHDEGEEHHEKSDGEGGTKDTDEREKRAFESKVFTDAEIANIVDMVLQEDDLNGDGYIEYVEFVTAQRKARGDSNK